MSGTVFDWYVGSREDAREERIRELEAEVHNLKLVIEMHRRVFVEVASRCEEQIV